MDETAPATHISPEESTNGAPVANGKKTPAASRSMKAASALNLTFALGTFATGLVYAFANRFMPYHGEIAGMAWEEVPPRLRTLHLAFQHGAGFLAVAFAILFAAVDWFAFRRGVRWAKVALPLAGLATGLPMLSIVTELSSVTGAGTPTIPLGVGVGMLAASGILAFLDGRRRR